jgi:hypothetical protein
MPDSFSAVDLESECAFNRSTPQAALKFPQHLFYRECQNCLIVQCAAPKHPGTLRFHCKKLASMREHVHIGDDAPDVSVKQDLILSLKAKSLLNKLREHYSNLMRT